MGSPVIYRFEGLTLDTAARRLRRGDQEVALEPKSFRLLEFLIENRNRVLTKDEIFRVVWEQTAVSDNALTRAIAQIRKALEDDPKRPRFIATLPTVGYRFVGELTVAEPPNSTRATASRERRVTTWVVGALLVVGVVAAGAGTWRFHHAPAQQVALTAEPLTSYRGNVESPSFSPDGTQVAFQWDGEKQDNLDIYVKAIGPDAVPLRLTNDPRPDRMPSWSPDGSTIAFIRIVAPGRGDLMLIPPLGGPERRVASIALNVDPVWFTREGALAWSADGKWLIVSAWVNQQSVLVRVSLATGDTKQITEPGLGSEDRNPAISQDGRTLLFNRLPEFYFQGTLFTVPLNENAEPVGAPKVMAQHSPPVSWAAWMPDGRSVVAVAANGLYRISVGDGEVQPVPGTGPGIEGVAVARQGGRLAYAVPHGDANVWRLDLTAKELNPQRLIASTFRDVAPRYSPDGNRIAFQSTRGGGRSQVWLADDAEAKSVRQLTFVKSGMAGTPHWSPDGKMVALDSNETGSPQIYTLGVQGGGMNQLTKDKFGNFGASWSRDGRWLYFTSNRTGRTEVWKMAATGGTAVQVTHNGGEFAVESEDGKTLYFARTMRGDSGSVWKMPIEGGPEKQVANSLYRVNFALARRGIYYMTYPDQSGACALMLYDFTKSVTSIVLRMGKPEYGLDVSPDGRYLVYAQLDDAASDLMLIEGFR